MLPFFTVVMKITRKMEKKKMYEQRRSLVFKKSDDKMFEVSGKKVSRKMFGTARNNNGE